MIHTVRISKRAASSIKSVPIFIRKKLLHWVESVEILGLEEVRKISGYHDEPLKGEWTGFRSIRLNRSYRAIYKILKDGSLEFVEIVEVNKHGY
ncbi:type II toxin-antitoxin system mRNA interferase toxin, RelE/StbE family [Bdellovibrio sp. NC01]|uniref:type II toxin-antitoxin system mRNA interferase toxin, RelE/StbE family n=1 Tax=Bdellovibrio sp. NC01 TaxID=2220073 RepID=UPI00115B0795|nr:type II toxin-antitoxin system mRNA interferase toxin, RelE/StbE family [Bdellovibrio sp. NC01]QDK37964.1 hypothetical protein DOE51_10375 [Bdellovibrio sp. NC01]